MARSKRIAKSALGGGKLALFEVIQAAQTRGGSHLVEAVAPIVAPAAGRELVETPPAAPAAVAETPPPPAAPADTVALIATAAAQVRAARPGRGRPERGVPLIGFATAVAALIAICGAGVLGIQHFSRRPPHQVSGSAPMPEVLDVAGAQSPTLARPHTQTRTEAVAANPGGPVVVPADFRRVNGLNYVLIQSYHVTEQAHAVATRDFLVRSGVGATVERGIPGWPNRLCVVGTEGFEQMKNNPKHQEYRRRLDELSSKATAADKKIRRFEPTEVQWGRS